MTREATAAERYLQAKLNDAEYAAEYEAASRRIHQIDVLVRKLDERRSDLELSKAELARRSGLRAEVVRRLFSTGNPNPTLSTLVALADALELEIGVTTAAQSA